MIGTAMSVFALETVGSTRSRSTTRTPTRRPSRRSRSRPARSWRRRSTPCRSASRSCSERPAAHILMRFFTVPNAKAARGSVVWAMFIIGFFYLLVRRALGDGRGGRRGGGHRRQTRGAEPGARAGCGHVRRRPVPRRRSRASRSSRSWPGSCCTRRARSRTNILVEHHPQGQGVREGGGRRRARSSSPVIGEGERRFMVGLAFAIAASANFPALLLALTWRRFNTTGAVCGVVLGVVSAIVLIILSPKRVAGRRDQRQRRCRSCWPTRGSSRSRSGSSAATWTAPSTERTTELSRSSMSGPRLASAPRRCSPGH